MKMVDVYKDSELTGEQLENVTRLLFNVFSKGEKSFDEILRIVKERMEKLKGTDAEITRFVIWDGQEAIAHARMFGRDVHTKQGIIHVGALSGVCVRADQRGKGYGVLVVKSALATVHQGVYPVCLWQTEVEGFYEKLGARVITNPFINSQNQENPYENPWPKESKMIYPADYPWPEGVVDLNGNAY